MSRARNFITTPLSVRKSALLAVAFGLVGPFLKGLLGFVVPSAVRPWAFLVLAICILILLYWRTDRSTFRMDKACLVHSVVAAILFLGAVPATVWCYRNHICMGGHMAHPPYAIWHYLCDAGWAIALAAISLWLGIVRAPLSIVIACIAAFLLSYRFVFGSFGGMYPIPL